MNHSIIRDGNVTYIGFGKTQIEADLEVNQMALDNGMDYMDIVESDNKPKITDNIHPRFSKSWLRDD